MGTSTDPVIQGGGGGNGNGKDEDESQSDGYPEIAPVDDVGRNTSLAQRAVQTYGSELSHTYSALRKALAEAAASTVTNRSTTSQYVHSQVLPRINAITKAAERMFGEYTTNRTKLVSLNSRIVAAAERKRIKTFMVHARLKPVEILAYRLSEERTQAFYLLKAWRVLSQVGALWVAQSVYMERYNQHILGSSRDPAPPTLTVFLTTFLGIDASIQLVTLLVLVFMSRLRPPAQKKDPQQKQRPTDTFLIDDAFLQTFLIEYFVTTLMIATLMLLCDRIIFRNKYFQLRENGSRSIRAYRAMLTGVCIVVNIIPFFIIFK